MVTKSHWIWSVLVKLFLLFPASLLTDPSIISEMIRDTEERTRELVDKYSSKMREKHVRTQFEIE